MSVEARPATLWRGRPTAEWAERWGTPQLVVYDSVPSTNDALRALAEAGAPPGTMVLAEHQSMGRGRLGRPWLDQPGASVLLSFLLRPRGGAAPGTAPLRVGMAATRAVRAVTGADIQLKWPNDLVIPGSGKVSGVLCEAVGLGAPGGYIIAGIGINVHQHPADLDPAYAATSLDSCTGHTNDRGIILDALTSELLSMARLSLGPLSDAEMREFASVDSLRGAFVTVDDEDDAHLALGIDATGALLVERAGTLRRLNAGTVRPTQTVGSS